MFHITRKRHVWVFASLISVLALVASIIVDALMFTPETFWRIFLLRSAFAGSIGFVVAFLAGKRMLSEHRLKMSLEYALNYDALTGAYSRSAIFRRIEAITHEPWILIIADIDHFKKVNDTWGHQAGDEVLRHFGKRVVDFLNDTFGPDVAAIGRIGGEEFLILVPETDLSRIGEWIDDLRKAFREGPLVSETTRLTLTASFGVALLTGDTVDTAIQEADSALYRAKVGGRDRACISGPAEEQEKEDETIREAG